MSRIEALKKLGFKLIEDVGGKEVKLRVPSEYLERVGSAEITVPRGKGEFGSIVTPDIPTQEQVTAKFEDAVERIRKEKEAAAEANRAKLKKKGMAAIAPLSGGMDSVDMSPLNDIKAGYEKYKEFKDKLFGAAADQMDLTKDKSATEDIKGVLSTVLDPVNAIPGAAGLGAAALEAGIEAIPSKKSKLEEYLKGKK